MNIQRKGSKPSTPGPASTFTGKVRIDTPFAQSEPGRVSGAIVTFEAGARSNWHTHSLGQILIVLSGLGRTQFEDGAVEEIRPGDVVTCPPNRRHWHGASPTTAMSHVAIAEALNGTSVEWLEPVTDEQYFANYKKANESK